MFCKLCTRVLFKGDEYLKLKHTEDIICLRCMDEYQLSYGAGKVMKVRA